MKRAFYGCSFLPRMKRRMRNVTHPLTVRCPVGLMIDTTRELRQHNT